MCNKFYMPVKNKYPAVKQKVKKKGKAIPLQAWTGPEGSRRSRLLLDF
jgi:hypothetical protein